MTLKSIQLLLTGCILFATLVSVSATCDELEQCFMRYGANVANSLGSSAQNTDTVVNFLCQNTELLTNCYDKFAGCDTYKSVSDMIPNKEQIDSQMKVVCQHKEVYSESVSCATNAILSLTQTELQKSTECLTNLLQSDDLQSIKQNCNLLNQITSCSPLMRATNKCSAKLMILLQENGVSVPCIETYRNLSSSSSENKTRGCIIVLLACYIFNIFIQKF